MTTFFHRSFFRSSLILPSFIHFFLHPSILFFIHPSLIQYFFNILSFFHSTLLSHATFIHQSIHPFIHCFSTAALEDNQKSPDKKKKKKNSSDSSEEEGEGEGEGEDGGGSNEEVSDEWWGSFLSNEDEFCTHLSGKLVLLAEVLKLAESIGDKVSVAVAMVWCGCYGLVWLLWCDISFDFTSQKPIQFFHHHHHISTTAFSSVNPSSHSTWLRSFYSTGTALPPETLRSRSPTFIHPSFYTIPIYPNLSSTISHV